MINILLTSQSLVGEVLPQPSWWYEFLFRVAKIIAILVVAFIVTKIFQSIVNRTVSVQLPTLAARVRIIGTWIVWVLASLIILPEIGIETTILTYLILLIGLAVVLASKNILENYITGQVIVTENQFKIGDWIRVDGYQGRVIEMTPINIIILRTNNEKVIIPNSFFSKRVTVNQTSFKEVPFNIPISVQETCNISKLEAELVKIGEEVVGKEVADRSPKVIVEEIGENAIKLNLRLWTLNPARIETIRSDINKRVKELFDKMNK